mmetsp:Transcript_31071/g.52481  ORF Transcript_31071/g.52481 Transcript_31071/m.52481 type:complete len:181 (-) Transcript_31071:529-1071(-)
MVEIIDLKLVAYGNTQQNSDGSFSCQHGVGECETDAIELCTQYKLSGDLGSIETGDTSLEAWPFILCMEEAEGVPTAAEGCYASSFSNSSDISVPEWSTIATCADEEFDLVQTAAMKATPTHQYVPWCLVDGAVLENTNLLQKAICDAYTGTAPASCKGLKLQESADRCYPAAPAAAASP